MAKKTEVKMHVKLDLTKLNELQKVMEEKWYAKVGILGKDAATPSPDTGTPMSVIGLVHEFGSSKQNIPQRSFLRFPLEFKSKDILGWMKYNKKWIMEQIVNGKIKKFYEALGIEAERIIQEAFHTGGWSQWAPLSQLTIKIKKSATILIDKGHLRRVITSKAVKKV